MKVLFFIDDDDAAHTYHKLMAEEAGFSSECLFSFYNVDSALKNITVQLAQTNSDQWPTYVFIDLNMPIKSGFDFVDEIEAIVEAEKMPDIFLVSSSKNPMDVEKANKYSTIKGFETKFLEMEFFVKLRSEN